MCNQNYSNLNLSFYNMARISLEKRTSATFENIVILKHTLILWGEVCFCSHFSLQYLEEEKFEENYYQSNRIFQPLHT